jgi:hypothetical protein
LIVGLYGEVGAVQWQPKMLWVLDAGTVLYLRILIDLCNRRARGAVIATSPTDDWMDGLAKLGMEMEMADL